MKFVSKIIGSINEQGIMKKIKGKKSKIWFLISFIHTNDLKKFPIIRQNDLRKKIYFRKFIL